MYKQQKQTSPPLIAGGSDSGCRCRSIQCHPPRLFCLVVRASARVLVNHVVDAAGALGATSTSSNYVNIVLDMLGSSSLASKPEAPNFLKCSPVIPPSPSDVINLAWVHVQSE